MAASDQRLYFLLQRVAHRLKKRADAALQGSAEITTAQAAALSIIASKGPVTQRYLAERLSQRESAVMTMTNRLMAAGYITRVRSKSDGRAWELTATDQGRNALDSVREPFSEINRLIDRSIGPEEVDELAAKLQKLLIALQYVDDHQNDGSL